MDDDTLLGDDGYPIDYMGKSGEPRCYNCLDVIYMTDLGDGLYRCPICGDERDLNSENGRYDWREDADDPHYPY